MKKILYYTCIFFTGIFYWSCSDKQIDTDLISHHDYNSDAEILIKFVDVNTSTGEYYINDSKVISPIDFISNVDVTKLKEVSPLNRSRFEKELTLLNNVIDEAVHNDSISQIVYNLYGGKSLIRTIDAEYPMLVSSSNMKIESLSRSQISYMELVPNLPQNVTFNGPSIIQSVVDINMFGYKAYSFRITTNDGDKTPSGDYPAGGGSNSKAIVMTGMTSIDQYTFTWNKTSGGSKWNFTGTLSNPSSIGQCLISVKFLD